MNCGIFELTEDDITTLDKAFEFAYNLGKITEAEKEWQELSLSQFIKAVIAMLPTGF